MTIAVVLVNWNGHFDTAACLESLACLEEDGFRVFVADNSSDSSSIDHIINWCEGRVVVQRHDPAWNFVASQRFHKVTWAYAQDLSDGDYPFLTILNNKVNLGFAGANNAATRLALLDPKISYVWYLNNDTLVASGAIKAQLDRMKRNPELGILGATVVYYHEPMVVQALGGAWFCPLSGRGDHIGRGLPIDKLPDLKEVEPRLTYVLGASMFVSRRFLEVVGLMNEQYFLFMEEIDWSERNQGRFTLGWEPAAVVLHKEGSSTGSSQHARPSPTALYYQNVNLLRFNRIYHPLFLPVTIFRLIAIAGRYALRSDFGAAGLILSALRDYLFGRVRQGPIDP